MKRQNKVPRWLVAWILQIVESLLVGAAAALSLWLHPALHAAALWALVPVAGALTAFAAVRRGLLNYAAWIAPPACLCVAHTLIWGYLPPAGPMLLCAFVSLIGSAAGEVLNQKNQSKNGGSVYGKGSHTHL